MSEQTHQDRPNDPAQNASAQNDSAHNDSAENASCGTSGSGCRPCGGGRLLLFLLAGLVVAYLISNRAQAPAAASAVNWVTDYDQALVQAEEKDQPVLLAFKATWCGPCRTMDNQVFAKEAAAGALSGWIPVSVDVDKQGKVADQYDIAGVPTFIALSPAGKEIARTSGGMSLQEFAQFLARAEAQLPAVTTARAN